MKNLIDITKQVKKIVNNDLIDSIYYIKGKLSNKEIKDIEKHLIKKKI